MGPPWSCRRAQVCPWGLLVGPLLRHLSKLSLTHPPCCLQRPRAPQGQTFMSSPRIPKELLTLPCLGSPNERGKICKLQKQSLELIWGGHFDSAPRKARKTYKGFSCPRSGGEWEQGRRVWAGAGTPVFLESLGQQGERNRANNT